MGQINANVRRTSLYALTICLVALAGCDKSSKSVSLTKAPRPVRVEVAKQTATDHTLSYPGTIQARYQANLGFRVAGKVTQRASNAGDRVQQGQLLARLDPSDQILSFQAAQQAKRAAEAELANARTELNRYRRLGQGSPAYLAAELDRRQTANDVAEARLGQASRQLALAQEQIDYTLLKADADGFIAAFPVEVGQVVAAGQTIAVLAHESELEIVVDIPENRLADIRAATEVTATLWAAAGHPMPGRLREVGASADPVSRTFAVKIAITNPPPVQVGLGMTASVRFGRAMGVQTVILPASAIIGHQGAFAVWILDSAKQRAIRRPVDVASWLSDGKVAIASGISPGEHVITAGASEVDPVLPVVAWTGPVR